MSTTRPNPGPILNIVLYQPEIPGNTGAIGRTCVAIGAKLWLVRPLGFRVDEKTLRRAGLDYWQHLDWEVADHWDDLIQRLAPSRLWYFAKFGKRPYDTIEYKFGDSLVFGNETSGLPTTLASPERALRIRTTDAVRSLNLSCSVGVASFEAVRQFSANGTIEFT